MAAPLISALPFAGPSKKETDAPEATVEAGKLLSKMRRRV